MRRRHGSVSQASAGHLDAPLVNAALKKSKHIFEGSFWQGLMTTSLFLFLLLCLLFVHPALFFYHVISCVPKEWLLKRGKCVRNGSFKFRGRGRHLLVLMSGFPLLLLCSCSCISCVRTNANAHSNVFDDVQ